MKNRRLLLFIFGLLVLIYFWGSKNKDGTTSPDKTVSSARVKSIKLIEEKIRLEKEKSTASASPTPDASFTGINPKIKETQKSCWERIRDQYQTNPDYASESHQRLNDLVGNWYYSKGDERPDMNIEESSPQGKFFLALAKAGLLEGSKIDQDEDQALLLLEHVALTDPQNSAPFLYAAIIENRRGNRERAQELLREANRSTHFDSYLKDFTFALFDGARTPSDLLAAQEIWSTVPVPNYTALREILEVSKQPNIANQLVKDGLRDDRERLTDLSWIPIEYSVGKKLLDSYGKGKNIPEYRDLLRKHPSTLLESGERIVSKLDSTCNLESINDEVEKIRNYLDQVRIKGL